MKRILTWLGGNTGPSWIEFDRWTFFRVLWTTMLIGIAIGYVVGRYVESRHGA